MSLPILVSCTPVLSNLGILGRYWHPLWEPESPRLALSGLSAYQWDSLYHRMRQRPVEGRQGRYAPISPFDCMGGGVKYANRRDFRGLQTPFRAQISYDTGLTCRLTSQGDKREPMLK